jgi:radical SAM superfamily enzyme YgiQ (UPF0313 family)
LRNAGCRILFIGIETSNQRSLTSVNKRFPTQSYERALAKIRRHKIAIAGYFLLGLDGDTLESFEEMFDFIHRTRVNVPILNILLPAPGTRIFERLDQEGRLLVRDEEDYLRNALSYAISCSHCFYRPALLTAGEVEEGLIRLRHRLSSMREMLWRSIGPDLRLSAMLFFMNAEFRRESKHIAEAWVKTSGACPGKMAVPEGMFK